MAKGLYRHYNLIIIMFYIKVLKNLIKVNSLKEAKNIIEIIINNFYFKIKVIYIKV